MRENADQNNSEYGHFLYSDDLTFKIFLSIFLRKFALEKNDKIEQKEIVGNMTQVLLSSDIIKYTSIRDSGDPIYYFKESSQIGVKKMGVS